MGLFSILNGAVSRTKTIQIDSSLGNVLLCGNSEKGFESIIRNYSIDTVNKGYGLIVIRDQSTGISTYPKITPYNRDIYSVDCVENSSSNQIDIFSSMSENDINNYIIKIFDMYNEIDRSKKMNFLTYISLLRTLCKKAGRKVKLNNLYEISIEDVEDMNYRFTTSPMEKSKNDRFLSSIRNDISLLESYFFDFSQNIIGNVFSGNRSIEDLIKLKPILEINLDFSSRKDESQLILSILVDAINRCNLLKTTKPQINIIVDGAPNDVLIESGLQKVIKSGKPINLLFSVQDISNLVEQSNEWIDYADSYFFFRQTSNKNKEFCSELFGTYEKKKETVTKSTNRPTFWSAMSGNSSSSKNTGTSYTYEKERVYTPELFANLSNNESIYYSKSRNEHMKLVVY